MHNAVQPPFGRRGFPRPPAIEREPKLIGAGLRIGNSSAGYGGVDAELTELVEKALGERGQRLLFVPQLLRIVVRDLKRIRAMKAVIS